MYLTPSQYDRSEKEGAKFLPNRVLAAFAPVLFQKANYPSRVQTTEQLWRFTDVMQEHRAQAYVERVLNGLTEAEFRLFQLLTSSVAEFSEKSFGRKIGGWNAILQSLHVFRTLTFLNTGNPCRVLEIGPGCGYLGVLLVNAGFSYSATDVTQALYLYQNNFWNYIFPERVRELVGTEWGPLAWQSALDASRGEGICIHLPWWQYVDLYKGALPTFDIVTCNNVMAEMHYDSLAYSLKLARIMLSQSSGPRLLVCEGFGWNATLPWVYVVEQLYLHGFVIAHRDANMTILALRDHHREGKFQELKDAAEKGEIIWSNGNVLWDERLNDFCKGENGISNHILRCYQELRSKQTVNLDQVTNFYSELLGHSAYSTEDERFWEFIQHPKQ